MTTTAQTLITAINAGRYDSRYDWTMLATDEAACDTSTALAVEHGHDGEDWHCSPEQQAVADALMARAALLTDQD